MIKAGKRPSFATIVLLTAVVWTAMSARISFADDAVKANEVPPIEAAQILGNADGVEIQGTVLQYVVDDPKLKKELRIPRLHSRLKKVSWKQDANTELKFVPEPEEWVIRLANPPEQGPQIVLVELLDPPVLGTRKIVTDVKPDSGETILPAHDADVTGTKLRFEPQPHKNTIGYWTNPQDWVSWTVQVDQACTVELEVFQGCGKGQGGSDVNFVLTHEDDVLQTISYVVKETGHFQNFQLQPVGDLKFPKAGTYRIEIRPQRLAAKAVMDVRQLVLKP
ncbi:hypothetical protein KOR42_31150 [Thalassoglobus neptunius]|uniref:Uncharacterized protein n=1 Tax=Thalassoglobus neptunius TaxID=1938619 RepID=A0A5C5WNR6_9PLAN|nr:hypothetical protein [Thalassoglobus neptunius]TWT52247.1 hypothetical protein KOR42_31150 [Thalassoglobus neptunius]